MDDCIEPTIEEHLASLGYADGWVYSLAQMISQFTGADSAIASARAVDMISHPRFGKAVAFFSKGFLTITQELYNGTDLSPNQKETMKQLIKGIVLETEFLISKP